MNIMSPLTINPTHLKIETRMINVSVCVRNTEPMMMVFRALSVNPALH